MIARENKLTFAYGFLCGIPIKIDFCIAVYENGDATSYGPVATYRDSRTEKFFF